MSTAVQGYTYQGLSTLAAGELRLQTCGGTSAVGAVAHPRFFTGFLTSPPAAAVALLAVAEVARTRYYQQLNPASLDPVVTGARDRLRFEAFSGCCGVYARLDVLPAGLDGEILNHGTTNVDVNVPLRQALARIGGLDPLHLAVGADDLTVSTMDGMVVEKKVPLPPRWLRGFADVQVIAAGFDVRAEIPAAEATTFLRRLPSRTDDRSVLWVTPAGRTLRLTSRPMPGAVCLPGPARLGTLRPLLRFARTLRVYGPPVSAGSGPVASVWELDTGSLRLSLTLSPEPHRGFSGEGAVLTALADAVEDQGDGSADASDLTDADLVAALLTWEPTVDVIDVVGRSGLPESRVRAALAQLGAAGQVGYDVADAAYFHRVLPFDAGQVERRHPRLVDARALVAAGAVTVAGTSATVHSGDEEYRVRLDGGRLTCTCLWWARYRGGRGPCKHALAAHLASRITVRSPPTVTHAHAWLTPPAGTSTCS